MSKRCGRQSRRTNPPAARDGDRSLLQNEQQHATSTTNVALDLVTMFKALGGGREQTNAPPLPRPMVVQVSDEVGAHLDDAPEIAIF